MPINQQKAKEAYKVVLENAGASFRSEMPIEAGSLKKVEAAMQLMKERHISQMKNSGSLKKIRHH